MWPINYEDKDKLHMSLGIGMIVAATVIVMISTNFYYSNLNQLDDRVSNHPKLRNETMLNGQTYLEQRTEGYTSTLFATKLIFYPLLISGLIFFTVGYFPYIKKQKVIEKKKK